MKNFALFVVVAFATICGSVFAEEEKESCDCGKGMKTIQEKCNSIIGQGINSICEEYEYDFYGFTEACKAEEMNKKGEKFVEQLEDTLKSLIGFFVKNEQKALKSIAENYQIFYSESKDVREKLTKAFPEFFMKVTDIFWVEFEKFLNHPEFEELLSLVIQIPDECSETNMQKLEECWTDRRKEANQTIVKYRTGLKYLNAIVEIVKYYVEHREAEKVFNDFILYVEDFYLMDDWVPYIQTAFIIDEYEEFFNDMRSKCDKCNGVGPTDLFRKMLEKLEKIVIYWNEYIEKTDTEQLCVVWDGYLTDCEFSKLQFEFGNFIYRIEDIIVSFVTCLKGSGFLEALDYLQDFIITQDKTLDTADCNDCICDWYEKESLGFQTTWNHMTVNYAECVVEESKSNKVHEVCFSKAADFYNAILSK